MERAERQRARKRCAGLNPSSEKYEAVARLRKWWTEQGGSGKSLVSISNNTAGGRTRNLDTKPMTAGEMKLASNLVGETPEFYTVFARLTHVATQKAGENVPIYYMACPAKVVWNGRPTL
jgi:hypothetical protein